MATGVVLSFDDEQGFGFIRMDDGETAFVHHSSIEMDGFRSLKTGDQVSFDVLVGKRGVEAKHVNKIPQ